MQPQSFSAATKLQSFKVWRCYFSYTATHNPLLHMQHWYNAFVIVPKLNFGKGLTTLNLFINMSIHLNYFVYTTWGRRNVEIKKADVGIKTQLSNDVMWKQREDRRLGWLGIPPMEAMACQLQQVVEWVPQPYSPRRIWSATWKTSDEKPPDETNMLTSMSNTLAPSYWFCC